MITLERIETESYQALAKEAGIKWVGVKKTVVIERLKGIAISQESERLIEEKAQEVELNSQSTPEREFDENIKRVAIYDYQPLEFYFDGGCSVEEFRIVNGQKTVNYQGKEYELRKKPIMGHPGCFQLYIVIENKQDYTSFDWDLEVGDWGFQFRPDSKILETGMNKLTLSRDWWNAAHQLLNVERNPDYSRLELIFISVKQESDITTLEQQLESLRLRIANGEWELESEAESLFEQIQNSKKPEVKGVKERTSTEPKMIMGIKGKPVINFGVKGAQRDKLIVFLSEWRTKQEIMDYMQWKPGYCRNHFTYIVNWGYTLLKEGRGENRKYKIEL